MMKIRQEIPVVREPGTIGGIVVDGTLWPLEGEPPIARTHGWGIVPGSSTG